MAAGGGNGVQAGLQLRLASRLAVSVSVDVGVRLGMWTCFRVRAKLKMAVRVRALVGVTCRNRVSNAVPPHPPQMLDSFLQRIVAIPYRAARP